MDETRATLNSLAEDLRTLLVRLRVPVVGNGDYYTGLQAGYEGAADNLEQLLEFRGLLLS